MKELIILLKKNKILLLLQHCQQLPLCTLLAIHVNCSDESITTAVII